MSLPKFPDQFLRIRAGFIFGKTPEWIIILVLEPFTLDDELVETKLDFDSFRWSVPNPLALANTTHEFPDAEDADRGSIYLRNAHHRAIVYRVAFGEAINDTIEVTIVFKIDFDVEGGGFENRLATISATLQCKEPRGVASFRLIK